MFSFTFTTLDLAVACVSIAAAYVLWLSCFDPDRAMRRSMRRKREAGRRSRWDRKAFRDRKAVAL